MDTLSAPQLCLINVIFDFIKFVEYLALIITALFVLFDQNSRLVHVLIGCRIAIKLRLAALSLCILLSNLNIVLSITIRVPCRLNLGIYSVSRLLSFSVLHKGLQATVGYSWAHLVQIWRFRKLAPIVNAVKP